MKSFYGNVQQINIDSAVNQMVELALPRFTKDKVLKIVLNWSISNYDLGFQKYFSLSIVYYRPSNYTFVGKLIDPPFLSNESEIIKYSDHDSCWRDDGTSRIIHEFIEKSIEPKIPTKIKQHVDTNIYVSFGLGQGFENGSIKTDDDNTAKFISVTES